jgi:hypothetical protein
MTDGFARPEGFEHERNDCTIRAVATIGKLDYKAVHKVFKIAGRKDNHGISFYLHAQEIFGALELFTYKIRQKKKVTVKKFIKRHPKGRFLCHKRSHLFCVIDGQAFDCRSLNDRIINAWQIRLKEELK